MATTKQKAPETPAAGVHIRFNLLGLSLFSAALILATGLLSLALERPLKQPTSRPVPTVGPLAANSAKDVPPAVVPPWGELLTEDVEIERPEEFLGLQTNTNWVPTWIFDKMNPDQVRTLLLASGLTAQQTARALSAEFTTVTASNTTLHPDDALVLSLSPDARAKLYGELAKTVANNDMRFPVCFPGNSFEEAIRGVDVPENIAKLVKSLLYRRGDAQYFSDSGVVMRRLPTERERLDLIKVLSRQPAVLARLRIRPNTDIDKLLGYWAWAPGVRFMDLRTLLESIKRRPDGGHLSLVYLLPPFARERLYTYPLPSEEDEAPRDCFWSAMNFFNETPDNRFSTQRGYLMSYLAAHYYLLSKPTRYGDLIFLLDDKGDALHAGVYIADDIIFTKNGDNFMQAWTLMRLKDLIAGYSVNGPPRVLVYRNKNS